ESRPVRCAPAPLAVRRLTPEPARAKWLAKSGKKVVRKFQSSPFPATALVPYAEYSVHLSLLGSGVTAVVALLPRELVWGHVSVRPQAIPYRQLSGDRRNLGATAPVSPDATARVARSVTLLRVGTGNNQPPRRTNRATQA